MPNPYHDENGRFCSANERSAAIDRLGDEAAKAPTPEARFTGMQRWYELKAEYDTLRQSAATGSGTTAADPIVAAARRQTRPQTTPTRRAGHVKPTTRSGAPINPDADTLAVPERTTYTPALPLPVATGAYGRGFVGGKVNLDRRWRDVTDIAKDVRKDLHEAQAKGYLPKNLTFSVTGDKYAGGQGLLVNIRGAKDRDIYQGGVRDDRGTRSANAKEVERRVSAIVSQYHTDDSNPQVEYFHTNFNPRVTMEDERGLQYREAEVRRKQRMAAANTYKKNLKHAITQAGGRETYFEGKYNFEHATADGGAQVSLLDAPSPMLVVRTRNAATGGQRYSVYDLAPTVAHTVDTETLIGNFTRASSLQIQRSYGRYLVKNL